MNDLIHTPETEETTPQAAVVEEHTGTAPEKKPNPLRGIWKSPKKRKRVIWIAILAIVAAGIIWGMSKLLSSGQGESQILTDVVSIGSITSTVEGSGTANAKQSASITINTAGTVMDVYVTEGQLVEAGTPLFSIDSPAAKDLVNKAQTEVEVRAKELSDLQEAANNLTVTAEFAGKLMGVETEYQVGQEIGRDVTLCQLVDDHTMKLEQYYSYAYQGDIYAGQSVAVSIPAVMESLPGRVAEVNMVSRISAEGSKLFQAVIELENPGVLTKDMLASAVVTANGQEIYPYEQGKLEYNRTVDVKTQVSGEIQWVHIMDYLDVQAGESLMQITGDDSQADIFNAEEALRTAQESLADAQENLANLNAVAPITGTVIGLAISPGQEIAEKTAVINISDTTVIEVTANVDERNIAYIKPGMYVDVDQWGTPFSGYVDKVNLSPEMNNGVATYTATILVDNPDGQMYTGSSVTYSLVASQSDNCLVLPIQCVKYVPNMETGETMSVVFLQTDTRPDNAVDVDGTTVGVPAEGFYAVPVETGISDKNNVEILSGVNEGDVVFTQMLRSNSYG